MKTVKLVPTWEVAGRLLLECVEHGESFDAREDAKREILRGLRELDRLQGNAPPTRVSSA